MKRFIFILALIISMGIPISAQASQVIERNIGIANNRLTDIEVLLNSSNTGLYNAIDMLGYVYEYTLWTDYIVTYMDSEVSTQEKKLNYRRYSDFISNYNSKYGGDITLSVPAKTKSSYLTISDKIVSEDIPKYVRSKMDEIFTEYSTTTDVSAKQLFVNKNSILVTSFVTLFDTYYDVYAEVKEYKVGDAEYTSFPDSRGVLDFINTNYTELTKVSLEASVNLSSAGTILIDLSKPARDNLLDNGTNLSLNYLAILSASSVYTPFKSYTGDPEFISSLLTLAEEQERDNLLTLYSTTKNYVKPLYRVEVDDSGNTVGTAKLVTLEDLITDIEKGNSGALTTVKGKFGYDAEENNWIYRDGDSVSYAYDIITDSNRLNKPMIMYSNKFLRTIDNMTYSVLNNIIGNVSNLNSIKNKDSKYLFINAYGDVVTEENLVILPGMTNPLLYKDGEMYNPYTVAFMNSYPSISVGSSQFTTVSKSDIGQYIMINYAEDTANNNSNIYKIASKNNVDTNYKMVAPLLFTSFYVNGSEISPMIGEHPLMFGDINSWDADNPLWERIPVITRQANLLDNTSIFPYSNVEDTFNSIAAIITQNMYKYLTSDSTTNVTINMQRLNDLYLNAYSVTSTLEGTNNPIGYTKDKKLDYDKMTSEFYSTIQTMLYDFSIELVDIFGNIDGVIGIGNFYDHTIFGRVFIFLEEQIDIVLMVVLIVVALAMFKNFKGYSSVVTVTAFTVGLVWCFIVIIPTYLPIFYNLFLSNFGESLAYEAVMLNTEDNNSVLTTTIDAIDEKGNFIYDTNAITLFRESITKKEKLYENLSINSADANSGNIHIINQKAGMFIEGDAIKVNSDILMSTLKINAAPLQTDTGIRYQFIANKTVSNSVDYYIPYYQFVDSFINKLNMNISLMSVPRKLITYSNGVTKDNFGVYSYVNSPQFLTPGAYNFNFITGVDGIDINQEDLKYYQDLQAKLEANFGTNLDFLGIEKVLIKDVDKYTSTVWYRALQKEGYYALDGTPDLEMISDLIDHVNHYTRKFIFDNLDSIGVISDETLIKIICLKAVTLMSTHASSPANFIYPYTMTYNDIKLEDVFKVTMIDSYTKYKSTNYDVVSYVIEEYGTLGIITFDIGFVLLFMVSVVLGFITILAYMLLPIFIIIRLLTNSEVGSTIKGYFQLLISLMVISSAVTLGIALIGNIELKAVSLGLMVALSATALSILPKLVKRVFKNPLNFGLVMDNMLSSGKIGKAFDKFKSKLPTNKNSHSPLANRGNNSLVDFAKHKNNKGSNLKYTDREFNRKYRKYDNNSSRYYDNNPEYYDETKAEPIEINELPEYGG